MITHLIFGLIFLPILQDFCIFLALTFITAVKRPVSYVLWKHFIFISYRLVWLYGFVWLWCVFDWWYINFVWTNNMGACVCVRMTMTLCILWHFKNKNEIQKENKGIAWEESEGKWKKKPKTKEICWQWVKALASSYRTCTWKSVHFCLKISLGQLKRFHSSSLYSSNCGGSISEDCAFERNAF